MSGPLTKPDNATPRAARAQSTLSIALATLLWAAASLPARAQDCPPPVTATSPETVRPRAPAAGIAADQPIEFEADSLEAQKDGEMLLKGDVVITQGDRTVKTRDATYDTRTQSVQVDSGVEYTDSDLKVTGSGAHVDPDRGATFENAQFELPERNARGSASRINATQGRLQLEKVRYTTCPVGNEDWVLHATDIDINQAAGIGIGRGVRLDFKGLPLLYTPFISFPVGLERKSGFLFPTIGTSSNSGYSMSVPWYWNAAPNYDATFTPTWFSKRGLKLDTEARYLSQISRGTLRAEWLPHDDEFGDSRSLLRFVDRSDFTDHLRLDVDAANASDDHWFEDFGLGPEGTSISYLDRLANLTYLDPVWFATLRAQNFQTIDDTIAPTERPYTMLPQLAVRAEFPERPWGLRFGLDGELTNFTHNIAGLETGWRFDVAPEIRLPLRGAGVFLEPAASWRYTTYRLDGVPQGQDDAPHRSAPIYSLDGGLIFERLSGARQQRLWTLEPRFKYVYVPFRDQTDLPVFDTNPADLNLVQLFRTNRYVGPDRLSDENQVAVGVTTRLLDADSGQQYIAATVGQAFKFSTPRVTLPGEVIQDTGTSDIIAELDLRAYQHWNISMGVQWDPDETRSERSDVQLQYKPANDRIANLGYRFRRGTIEQLDGSVAWPVARAWSLYGRMVYSLQDEKALDQFAGLEYRSCCWRLRVVGRRYVSDRTGDLDASILVQLELNGLSSVGVGADAFLERSIRGYSLGPPDLSNSQ